ncbi:iron complex transport system ATP-binding protein [Austwickia chelonae]|uniref:Putative ABC transporter ATP-binding protein n=1 Tax=Austwickia chelonae NBRC 105200 TaxID=1184607 RepID=K6VT09_9MICO|nr:putative ABC transporter ATP-binding protein [Austwickia chelonae NBRC 105200]SEW39935.1 iron complex transport system ATP-binding protein [Austwickia chelonae]
MSLDETTPAVAGPDSRAAAPRLTVHGARVGYGDKVVLPEVDLSIPTGVITTVIGPNGCGKSTLLRSLARLLPPSAGRVCLDGQDLYRLRPRQVATVIGLLPQMPVAPEGMTVADLVALGRHPHHSWWRQWAADDADHVRQALELTGVGDLAGRSVDTLSGGQRQRVWLAMALAQDTDVVLLDEPSTYLDLAHALDLLDLVDVLHDERGRTVVMVLHDLVLATRYSDHLVVMKDGRVVATGAPQDVVTEELLSEVFGLQAQVVPDPVSDRPLIVPIGRRHTTVVC